MKKKAKIGNLSIEPFSKRKKVKAIVLFSGGLDSRLAAKLVEDQGFEVHLCFVKLPFGGGCCSNLPCVINFGQTSSYKLHIVDATKEELFEEYIELVKKPKYGIGKGMNPCKDCKIFIFRQAKKLADEIGAELIATGEVIGQRPMSQMKKALLFDEEMAGLSGKVLRPLSAKVLPETEYEKSGLIDREKLFGIEGRRREEQIKLAEKYKINYPTPGGGCLLCEKDYTTRLKCLMKYKNQKPDYLEILFLKRGRMFKYKGVIFLGRNLEENIFIRNIAKELKWNIFFKEDVAGPTIVYDSSEDQELVEELWKAYSSGTVIDRKKFEDFKI